MNLIKKTSFFSILLLTNFCLANAEITDLAKQQVTEGTKLAPLGKYIYDVVSQFKGAVDKNLAIQMKLHEAISKNDLNAVKEAIQAGASPLLTNPFTQCTPLYDSLENIAKYSTNSFGPKAYKGFAIGAGTATVLSVIAIIAGYIGAKNNPVACNYDTIEIFGYDTKFNPSCEECQAHALGVSVFFGGILGTVTSIFATKSLWKYGNNAATAIEILKVLVMQSGFMLDSKSKEFLKKFTSLNKIVNK